MKEAKGLDADLMSTMKEVGEGLFAFIGLVLLGLSHGTRVSQSEELSHHHQVQLTPSQLLTLILDLSIVASGEKLATRPTIKVLASTTISCEP